MDGDATAAAWVYAWWLTGDEARAQHAVRDAVAGDGHRDAPLELLRAVRAAAIAEPTMCPASELALLHDVHGLALAEAAELVSVDERDARTELAHGRLEALAETFEGDLTHPERLGGLALGNPADVAHARQCGDCGEVSSLLARGRDTLTDLAWSAPPPAPASFGAAVPAPAGDLPAPPPAGDLPRPRPLIAAVLFVVLVVGLVAGAVAFSVP